MREGDRGSHVCGVVVERAERLMSVYRRCRWWLNEGRMICRRVVLLPSPGRSRSCANGSQEGRVCASLMRQLGLILFEGSWLFEIHCRYSKNQESNAVGIGTAFVLKPETESLVELRRGVWSV